MPRPNPDDEVDEKNYYEKSEREKLFENLERLDIALNQSVLAYPYAEDFKPPEDSKEIYKEENTVIGWDVEDIAIEFEKVQDIIDKIVNQTFMEQGPNGNFANNNDPSRYQPSLHNESNMREPRENFKINP